MVANRTFRMPPSVASVVAKHQEDVRLQYEPICERLGIEWPPQRIQLLAFKQEALLEVWVANPDGPFEQLTTFPILRLSGKAGPKRKRGDRQVPEGFYKLTALNPQSSFHLSIRIDYPNQYDIDHAIVSPDRMGGDIYIHGRHASVGCLAMGDPAIEKLFCLIALARPGERNITIAPTDFRAGRDIAFAPEDPGVKTLYDRLKASLSEYAPARNLK